MITADVARELTRALVLSGYGDLAEAIILISCARCSAPMIAQEPDNTPDNDSLEVCSRCTRALYTEPPETGAQP